VELVNLTVERFRNLHLRSFELSSGVNLLLGRNGVGKTSLLEAMVVLANVRSFRAGSPRRLVRHGETAYRLAGTVRSRGRTHHLEQVVEVGPPVQRQLRLDGANSDVARYLSFFPLFAISGLDREIVVGPPDGRRALLDRFTFLLKAGHLDDLRAYRRVLRQRNAALIANAGDAEIAVWEQALAEAAARVIRTRQATCRRLGATFAEVYRRLATEDAPPVVLEYRGDPWWSREDDEEKLVEKHLQRYNETRPRDRQTGFTADGPHRHDLNLRTEGRSTRYVLSTGQVKVVAAALRLAPHAEIERERGESLPVIVDDVDAELDSAALARLVGLLGHERQLFLSSTNDRAGEAVGHRTRRFWLENGACVKQEAEIDE
jgi:DNA replication and repair protein RecF